MKMTLDFAIKHCHDCVDVLRNENECSCADEHEQLAIYRLKCEQKMCLIANKKEFKQGELNGRIV